MIKTKVVIEIEHELTIGALPTTDTKTVQEIMTILKDMAYVRMAWGVQSYVIKECNAELINLAPSETQPGSAGKQPGEG